MASISRLPLCSGIPPTDSILEAFCERRRRKGLRINNEDSRSFCKIERNASSFETDKEDFHMRVIHEEVNAALTLGWGHATIQHDRSEASTTKAPFHELEH
jgi:hypothetical protein